MKIGNIRKIIKEELENIIFYEFDTSDMPAGTSWKVTGKGWAAKNRNGVTDYWYGKDETKNKENANNFRNDTSRTKKVQTESDLVESIMDVVLAKEAENDSEAARKAKEMGLVHLGWGHYGPDVGKPATHTSQDGRLVPVKGWDHSKDPYNPTPITDEPPSSDVKTTTVTGAPKRTSEPSAPTPDPYDPANAPDLTAFSKDKEPGLVTQFKQADQQNRNKILRSAREIHDNPEVKFLRSGATTNPGLRSAFKGLFGNENPPKVKLTDHGYTLEWKNKDNMGDAAFNLSFDLNDPSKYHTSVSLDARKETQSGEEYLDRAYETQDDGNGTFKDAVKSLFTMALKYQKDLHGDAQGNLPTGDNP